MWWNSARVKNFNLHFCWFPSCVFDCDGPVADYGGPKVLVRVWMEKVILIERQKGSILIELLRLAPAKALKSQQFVAVRNRWIFTLLFPRELHSPGLEEPTKWNTSLPDASGRQPVSILGSLTTADSEPPTQKTDGCEKVSNLIVCRVFNKLLFYASLSGPFGGKQHEKKKEVNKR